MIYNSTELDVSNPPLEIKGRKYPTWKVTYWGKCLSLKLGIYSGASMQAHQCKTLMCSDLGQKQDLKVYYEEIIR